MQSNPLHFLTDRQLRALAGLEGLTVPQILSKYRNFRTKEETEVRRKAPETNAVKAMKLLHSGQASSLQEAWDLVRGRKVVRGRQLGNPSATARKALASVVKKFSGEMGTIRDYPGNDSAAYVYFPSGTSEAAINAFGKKEGVSARLARHHSPGQPVYMGLFYSPPAQKNPRKGRARSPYRRNGGGAAEAMRLYHSGQASSLQEAWDIVKGGRR
jgi:hypothetical protein